MAFGADELGKKRRRLNSYTTKFDKAVNLITSTIGKLGAINEGIDSTIQDINDYQQELAETKAGLEEARRKNDKVIANFQALLSV